MKISVYSDQLASIMPADLDLQCFQNLVRILKKLCAQLAYQVEYSIQVKYKMLYYIQSNFGRSNSPVSNTRDRSNSFVGPGNFPIHLMLKYTPDSNSDGSNPRTQSTVRRAIFRLKTL